MVELTTKTFDILSLYLNNYSAKYYVREIATLLGMNHVTLLPYLDLLEKHQVLTPETKGRNKIFSLNHQNITTRNYLAIAEHLKTIKYLEEHHILKLINNNLTTETAILFGSYAKQTQDEQSDIDLCILSENNHEKIEALGKRYGIKINIKTILPNEFTTEDPLSKEIIENHVILNNPEQFIDLLWRQYEP